jgi:membrane-associated phospholipid phosphatase
VALLLGAHIYDLYLLGSLSTTTFAIWIVVLIVYVLSIVGSRVYTGMHGFMDCSVGIILGVISWLLQHLLMPEVEKWALSSGWSGASSFPRGDSPLIPSQRP